jgi:hypothetical protein
MNWKGWTAGAVACAVLAEALRDPHRDIHPEDQRDRQLERVTRTAIVALSTGIVTLAALEAGRTLFGDKLTILERSQ